MPADFDNLSHGPAQVLLDDGDIGHTQGGVTVKVTPQNRMRKVDQFGEGELNAIHTGDQVRITIPFAEWTALVLSKIYAAGLATSVSGSSSGYVGIGRAAGLIYATADMKVVPLVTAEAVKKCQFFRTCPIGEFTLTHNTGDDRIFSVDWAALVDEAKAEGERIGRIFRS